PHEETRTNAAPPPRPPPETRPRPAPGLAAAAPAGGVAPVTGCPARTCPASAPPAQFAWAAASHLRGTLRTAPRLSPSHTPWPLRARLAKLCPNARGPPANAPM